MEAQVNTQNTTTAPPPERRMTLLEMQVAIESLMAQAIDTADPDTGEIRTDLGAALESLTGDRAVKIDAYALLLERLGEEEAALDARVKEREARVKEMRARRDAIKARIKQLRDRIAQVAMAEGGEVEGIDYRVRMQNGATALEDLGEGFPIELADEALNAAIERLDRDALRSLVGSERLKRYVAEAGDTAVGFRLRTVSFPKFSLLAGSKPKSKAKPATSAS